MEENSSFSHHTTSRTNHMETKPLLSVRDLSVILEGKKLLNGISFSISAHEVLAIIGPNGAGKSLLLKTLLGIVPHTGGTIAWSPEARIGYLPQRFHVDAYLPITVKEFLKLKPSSQKDFEDTLRLLPIDASLLNKKLSHISSGQLQKILLTWTLLDKPNILLFDEPTENVDVVGQESIYNILHELQDRLGIALIIISHDLNVVYQYANQVLCLNGTMLCYGEPEEALSGEKLKELYGSHTLFHHNHADKTRNTTP